MTIHQGYSDSDYTKLKALDESVIIKNGVAYLPHRFYCEQHDIIEDVKDYINQRIDDIDFNITPLYYNDWLAINQASFQPIHIYPFSLIPSHLREQQQLLHFPKQLYIDAAAAFGTGHHATTHGCLKMLHYLHQRSFHGDKILDVGSGSGILSLAAQYFWRDALIIGGDIDEKASMQARYNADNNLKADQQPIFITSEGLNHGVIHHNAPYDLIIGNILLNPLLSMAQDIFDHSHRNSILILSGITIDQYAQLRQKYRHYGFKIMKYWQKEQWLAVVLCRI